MVKPGKESSEYWKALRTEVVGVIVLLTGLFLTITALGQIELIRGLGLTLVGANLMGSALRSYAAARGDVKAAASRRTADVAPRSL